MRHRISFVFFIMACCMLTANAQMTMVNNFPSNNGSAIPLQTTLSFTFSEPLDTTARWNNPHVPLAILAEPADDWMDYGALSYSPDLLTINIDLTLQANMRYCWLITNARATNGDTLDHPFDMSFTTASAVGPRSMGGAISWPGHSPIGIVVGLFDAGPDNDHRHLLFCQAVGNNLGNYYFFGIQPGTYWFGAAMDVNHDGVLGYDEPRAEYDPDGDGHADSLVIGDGDMWGYGLVINVLSTPQSPASLPKSTALAQNYPNPFNPTTEIQFSLPHAQNARLAVFDVLGREVAVLANGMLSAGSHTVRFDGASVPSGMYFYRLHAGTESFTRKMMLLK